MIEVDLGAFKPELAGERIAGKIAGNRLLPFASHAQINAGALGAQMPVIAWMDPNDLLFLQIQGSGRLRFDNGDQLRLGYDGQNGHAYTAVGKVLVDEGEMPLSEVSMQSIREWLASAHPASAQRIREANASYVFFRKLEELSDDTLGPLGAQSVPLTAKRSLAVDRRFHAMGTPVWLELESDPAALSGGIFRKLMIAQDTGGAIRGPVRGDVFWGAGDYAGEIAGNMRANGRMFVLLPKEVAARLPAPSAP